MPGGSQEKSAGSIPGGSWRALALFFFLAFGLTWVFLIPAVTVVPDAYETLLIVLAAFGPFGSAVITIRISEGKDALRKWLRSLFRFRIPFTLYLAGAFVIPLLIGSLQFIIYRILGGAPGFEGATPWYQYLAYLIPTALLSGGNEEPGWRGYALPVLTKLSSPIAAGLILGSIHSLWHLPMMDVYGTNILWYAFNLIPLTFLFNWFFLNSHRSIWPVMLFHAGTNVIGGFMPTPDNVLGSWGDFVVLRGLVYWIMAAGLFIATRKFWIGRDYRLRIKSYPAQSGSSGARSMPSGFPSPLVKKGESALVAGQPDTGRGITDQQQVIEIWEVG